MSSIFIISVIIIFLSVLVCYAFVSQTIKTKREEKQRQMLILKKRKNTFMFMLNGFPAGFLPPEMALLVQNSLIDTLEQLNQLDPSNTTHAQDLQIVTQRMIESKKERNRDHRVQMESYQQVKEVKMCLQELHKFIHNKERLNEIPVNRSENLQAQIKQLVVHITVDSYELSGKSAKDSGKPQLALHYYQLALKLLHRESKSTQKAQQIKEYKDIIQELNIALKAEEQAKENEQAQPTNEKQKQTPTANEVPEEDAGWDAFNKEQDIWKKNNVYD